MKHKFDSFLTVFTLELFLGKEKEKKSKQDCNAPSSSSFIKFFINIITNLLWPSRELSLHPRDQFVVLLITIPFYFMIFDEVQIQRVEETH